MSTSPLEATYVRRHKKLLKDAGAWVQKTQAQGVADLLVCYNGVFIAIEVKRPHPDCSVLRPAQTIFLQKIRAAGGVAFAAYGDAGVEETARVIEALSHRQYTSRIIKEGNGTRLFIPIFCANVSGCL